MKTEQMLAVLALAREALTGESRHDQRIVMLTATALEDTVATVLGVRP